MSKKLQPLVNLTYKKYYGVYFFNSHCTYSTQQSDSIRKMLLIAPTVPVLISQPASPSIKTSARLHRAGQRKKLDFFTKLRIHYSKVVVDFASLLWIATTNKHALYCVNRSVQQCFKHHVRPVQLSRRRGSTLSDRYGIIVTTFAA